MSAIVLNQNFEKDSELALPESFEGINPHNLYLYVNHIRQRSAPTLQQRKLALKSAVAVKNHGLRKAVAVRVPVHAVLLYG
jgi:large subunit ribosomal protein L4